MSPILLCLLLAVFMGLSSASKNSDFIRDLLRQAEGDQRDECHCRNCETRHMRCPSRTMCDCARCSCSSSKYLKSKHKHRQAESDVKCGVNVPQRPMKNGKVDTKIVGGQEAIPFGWPWQVSIQYIGEPPVNFCGGSIINKRWILTAAHCFKNNVGDSRVVTNVGEFVVAIGKHELTPSEPGQQIFGASEIIIHEGWQPAGDLTNDIALVRLDGDIVYGKTASPVCLPKTDVAPGTLCVVAGWGDTSSNGQASEKLLEVYLPIITNDDCETTMGTMLTSQMCAGYKEGGKDSCQGDSGGPFVCYDKSSNTWKQQGVVSYGDECAKPDSPGVYTRVTSFTDWIVARAGTVHFA